MKAKGRFKAPDQGIYAPLIKSLAQEHPYAKGNVELGTLCRTCGEGVTFSIHPSDFSQPNEGTNSRSIVAAITIELDTHSDGTNNHPDIPIHIIITYSDFHSLWRTGE